MACDSTGSEEESGKAAAFFPLIDVIVERCGAVRRATPQVLREERLLTLEKPKT